MADMNDCIFCRIIPAGLEASRLLENETMIAFLDVNPVNAGHALVVPRRHVTSFRELSPAELKAIMLAAQEVAGALRSKMPGCEGISLTLADGEAAGQEVPHVHLHVIPRHGSDGFGWKRHGQRMERPELDAIAARLREGACP